LSENKLSGNSEFENQKDFELIRAFNDGDEDAFKKLFLRHKENVRNLIYLTLGNTDYIDDIMQDVFIKVYDNLGGFRFESKFSTWLYKITVNKCKDHLKKKYVRKVIVPLDNQYNLSQKNKRTFEEPDLPRLLKAAIEKLPPKLKEPLIMRDIEELSYKEISEKMGIEIGAVKSRIFRARATLRALLEPYMKDEF
jgi:RNA polymerase sigma-70 factor (ECF subfamily)